MKQFRLGIVIGAISLAFSGAVIAQPGGGGGGFGGGGGGFGGGGGGAPGGRAGGQGGQGGQESGNTGPQIPDLQEDIPGRWEMEFRVDYFSEDPEASGKWMDLDVDFYLVGQQVEGRINEGLIRGTTRCTLRPPSKCEFGTIRIDGETQQWQDFGFEVEAEGNRAEGWAEWLDHDTGETMRFELRMRKR